MTVRRPSPTRLADLAERLRAGGAVRQDAEGPKLYALLDAARDPAIHPALLACQHAVPVRSLYQGELAETLADVCPYIVALEPGVQSADRLLELAWGSAWGLFVRSDRPIDVLRRSLRRFTVVAAEDGRSLLFRFYDPRVLRAFLPTATPEQAGSLFRDVDRFLVEDEDGAAVREYAWLDGGLRSLRHPLRD